MNPFPQLLFKEIWGAGLHLAPLIKIDLKDYWLEFIYLLPAFRGQGEELTTTPELAEKEENYFSF